MRRTRLLIILVLAVSASAGVLTLLLGKKPTATASPVNEFCPVMTGKEALADFEVEFRGKPVRFCCSRCVETFQANPSAFLADLPHLRPAEPQHSRLAVNEGPLETLWVRLGGLLNGLAALPGWAWILCGALVGAAVLLLVRRTRGRRVAVPFRFGTLLVLMLVGLGAALVWRQSFLGDELEQLKKEIQVLNREVKSHQDIFEFTLQQARSGMPNRIKCSFYRGNDERDSALTFGGNYRTATFHLSLCTEDGREVRFGDELLGQTLHLRLEIERAPHTAEGFFDDHTMNAVLLARGSGPVLRRTAAKDALGLTVLESKQRWEVRYPLGSVTDLGLPQSRGMLYVCLGEMQDGQRVPTQFHYWIHHDLFFKGGRIEPTSNLWMGPVYLVQNLRGPHLKEWFSHEPIPVLPGKNTEDPKLLGLDVHKAP